MITKVIGIGAAGNKAAINVVENKNIFNAICNDKNGINIIRVVL